MKYCYIFAGQILKLVCNLIKGKKQYACKNQINKKRKEKTTALSHCGCR